MTPPAAAAAPAVQPRRPSALRGPRRVSGPARPARQRVADRPSRARRAEREGGLILGLIGVAQGLARHRLLDRLIRGRTWIGLVAFALIGIVTLQLGLLKLNGGIGRALEHEGLLQRENATLSIENSELAAGTRVEGQAAHLGMAFVPSGAMRFLTVRPGSDATKAAGALSSASHAAGGGEASGTAFGESASGEQAQSSGTSSSAGESSAGESSSTSTGESQSGPHASTSESEQPTGEAREPSPAESSATDSEATAAAGSAPTPSESSSSASESSASESPPAGGAQGGTQASGTGG